MVRFTFINPKKRSPSFRAKYEAYLFFNMGAAQICSIVFALFLLWIFMPSFNPEMLASAVIIMLAIAFYFAYRSVQLAQLVFLLSFLGIQMLALFVGMNKSVFGELAVNADDLLIAFATIDIIVIGFIYYMNVVFPSYYLKEEK